MTKALQEFDLALRGTKKRQKFLKDGKKKELTVKNVNVALSLFPVLCLPVSIGWLLAVLSRKM